MSIFISVGIRLFILTHSVISGFISNNFLKIQEKSFVDAEILTIYHEQEKEYCSEWVVLQIREELMYFDQVIENRESGVFYHIDEENQTVTIQKKVAKEMIFLRRVFAKKNTFYDIRLNSCKTFLEQNKMKLEKICENIQNGKKLK